MISQTSLCVSPGAALSLDCDPGGECLDHCSWDTPSGDMMVMVTSGDI